MSDKPRESLAESVRQSLRMVIDPELGENVVDLGLIYEVSVVEVGVVHVEMTTTTAGCPAAAYLRDAVESAAGIVEGIERVEVGLTYDPPWTPEMMNADARAHLGFGRKAAGR
ncbi:metal-sulfur cluster assembly factor [Chelatococcus asaccharovorans]|jgi:metal-sulfur cluster biosynthetic enzyme|uniref:metal-sulfur cluster assembly factor n=1 Tax=Chelatococcus asaccharovorans TaxID=28210 RepID=UPI00224C7289|nr:metal-sulfur cluster assembly factor [Chelatococcus asaccharovorans]CAH1662171.1 Phenylacetic acid degradation protein paaD; PaaD-like protein involved in Fe-S cluster assembly [Chelatococcus asaccharovorans]CAH1690513.1 Phenylacetic acid degradation protein paaD; PaaD-like protein involved in Fe-S cluster assembly [Chelatococcus asaccharovorans]